MEILATDLSGEKFDVPIDSLPDICPICHHHIIPKMQAAIITKGKLCILLQCTNSQCNEVFISYYKNVIFGRNIFSLLGSTPNVHEKEIFNDEIVAISPDFIEIYNQSLIAEENNLNQICGTGYRKALEFLIKDYLKINNPKESEIIENEFLGTSIKNRVEDIKIKNCAERAVWLGNDETHYIRKWNNKDLSDLKLLIKLVTIWIESEILTRKYTEEMKTN